MLLVIGLGNPGKNYENNRHNIGFLAIDKVVRKYSFSNFRSKFHGEVANGTIANSPVLALKPSTFMNESGRCVQAAAEFYKISVNNIIVIHDEIDLAEGKVRVKIGGGHAGHNGLRSIYSHMGSGFVRVRIGVGHPGDKGKVAGYVLTDFAKAERGLIDKVVEAVGEYIPILIDGDHSMFMSKVAVIVSSFRPPTPKPRLLDCDANQPADKGD